MGGMDSLPSRSQLLSDIESFLLETGMGASYFGKKAVGNSELVARLRNGGGIELDTACKVQRFLSDNCHAEKDVSSTEDIQGRVTNSIPQGGV